MNKHIFILSILMLTSSTILLAENDTGRYQLFQGSWEAVMMSNSGDSRSSPQSGLLRIDSRTGDVWVLNEYMFPTGAKTGVVFIKRREWQKIEQKSDMSRDSDGKFDLNKKQEAP